MVQGAFAQRLRCGTAVFCKDFLFYGAGIHADPDRDPLLPADLCHLMHAVVRSDISGIDPDFIDPGRRGFQGQAVIEMDIRHQRHADSLFNRGNQPDGLFIRNRRANNVASGLFQLRRLPHASLYVLCGYVEHRLHRDARVPADGNIACHHLF